MVYLGIAPEEMSWYLRIYTEEIDEDGDNGYFDISVHEDISEELFMSLCSEVEVNFIKRKSPEYYDEITENG